MFFGFQKGNEIGPVFDQNWTNLLSFCERFNNRLKSKSSIKVFK